MSSLSGDFKEAVAYERLDHGRSKCRGIILQYFPDLESPALTQVRIQPKVHCGFFKFLEQFIYMNLF